MFVANRVAVIRNETDVAQWRHIGTRLNPADEASRGLSAESFLACERWLKGPEFILRGEVEWPKTIMEQPLIPVGDPEVKKDPPVNAFVSHRPLNATKVFLSYFSDFKKLRTSVAWMLRLRDVLLILSQRRKVLEISGIIGLNGGRRKDYLYAEMQREKLALHRQSLTTGDLERAEGAIICFCQQERFSVKINSDLYKLHPMLEDGLLLVGGRLGRAAMPEVA